MFSVFLVLNFILFIALFITLTIYWYFIALSFRVFIVFISLIYCFMSFVVSTFSNYAEVCDFIHVIFGAKSSLTNTDKNLSFIYILFCLVYSNYYLLMWFLPLVPLHNFILL